MDLKESIKNNKILTIITCIFIAFITYMLVVGLSSPRIVTFYDVYSSTDVSSNYTSLVPFLRYFIEPLVGLTYALAFNSDPTNILVIFFISYVILRIVVLVIDRKILVTDEKSSIVKLYVKNGLDFFVKYATLALIIMATYFTITFIFFGFLVVAETFLPFFHVFSFILLSLLAGKVVHLLIVYYHPKFALKLKKKPNHSKKRRYLTYARKEVFYCLAAFLLIFSINFTMLSIPFPTQQITHNLAANEILVDFHVHTTQSDGHLTPEERVHWYMDQGIHAAAFSDHHTVRGALIARDYVARNNLDFTVIIAQEFTADPENMHLNVFGIEVDLTPQGYTHGAYKPNEMNVSNMINWTKENGGYVIVNHYYTNATAPYTYDQLMNWGVDGFEVANGANWGAKYAEILAFCKNKSLIAISTTDQHVNSELNGFTKVTLNDPNNKTVEHIFESMNTTPPECVIIPAFNYHDGLDKDNPLWLLQAFTGYVHNLDALQVLSWVLWSVGLYFFIFYLNKRGKNVTMDVLNKKVIKEGKI